MSRARLPGDSAQGIVRIGNYERARFLRRTPANATRPDPNTSSVPGSGTRIVSDEFLGKTTLVAGLCPGNRVYIT